MSYEPTNIEEATEMWTIANLTHGCSCHVAPPCSFCVNGYSLSLDEYLETLDFSKEETTTDAYDHAMKCLSYIQYESIISH